MNPILPIPLNSPVYVGSLFGSRVCMYEIHNVYFHHNVGNTIVVPLVEMMSNRIFKIIATDIVEMALEAVQESMFGLSDVLDLTYFVSDTVNKITALTID